ncbi:hypothetical protein D6C85_08712 [Aureobasidium pullulans]|uniref:Rhodopsin domain-containing protein n=1 Tax=Aureobasidium pullulans TaxID=5580 RepID=A0A4S9WG18_AURPU|nr:hypothetical protein D6C85_08712 [Aureobasidium pullulans]
MDSGSLIVSSVWVLTGFSCITVIARMAMKILRLRGLALEDLLMFVSMGLAVVYGISTTLLYRIDYGRQPQGSVAYDTPQFVEILYISHAIGFLAPLFSRISFCLYMLRIISTVFAFRKRTLQLFVALQVVVNVTITILVFTQCGSFHTLWEHGMQRNAPSCIRNGTLEILALVTVTFNAITDLYLTILPAVVVWNIQFMTARAKLGLFATLGLSFFATIASICKIYYVYALYTYKTTLYIIGRLSIVMGVEVNVVIIAASIPIIAPLFLRKCSRNSIPLESILPTYEVQIEGASKSTLLQLATRFWRSPTGNRSLIRHDSGSRTTFSREGLDEDSMKTAHSQYLGISKTVCVAVRVLEQEQRAKLERESVPQSLLERGPTQDSDAALPLQAWDELPTPQFMSETDVSPLESE